MARSRRRTPYIGKTEKADYWLTRAAESETIGKDLARGKRQTFKALYEAHKDFFSDARYEVFITISWPYEISFKAAESELNAYLSNLERTLFYSPKAQSRFHIAAKGLLIQGTTSMHAHILALGSRSVSSRESLLFCPPEMSTKERSDEVEVAYAAEFAWTGYGGVALEDSTEPGFDLVVRDKDIHIVTLENRDSEPLDKYFASYMADPTRNAHYDRPDSFEYYFYNDKGLRKAANRYSREFPTEERRELLNWLNIRFYKVDKNE